MPFFLDVRKSRMIFRDPKQWMMPSCCLRTKRRKGRRTEAGRAADSGRNREGRQKEPSAFLYQPLHDGCQCYPGTRGRGAEDDSADRVCKTQRPGGEQEWKSLGGEPGAAPDDAFYYMQDLRRQPNQEITPELNDLQEEIGAHFTKGPLYRAASRGRKWHSAG